MKHTFHEVVRYNQDGRQRKRKTLACFDKKGKAEKLIADVEDISGEFLILESSAFNVSETAEEIKAISDEVKANAQQKADKDLRVLRREAMAKLSRAEKIALGLKDEEPEPEPN